MANAAKVSCHSRNEVFEQTQMANVAIQDEVSDVSGAKTSRWFSPETGIHTSKHENVQLPEDPVMDVVSFILSNNHSGVLALVDATSGASISYAELPEMIKSVAAGLHQIGVSRGQVVLILLPNSIYFPVIFLAVLSIGAIATPMNPLSTSSEIKRQVKNSGVVVSFTVRAYLDKVEKTGVESILVPEEFDSSSRSPEFSIFDKLLACSPRLVPRRNIMQRDTAALLYSSGTSGVSKGVVLTHANLIAMVKLFVQFEASQYDYPSWETVTLASLPMFHVYGLSLFSLGLLSTGSTVVVMKRFNEAEMVRTIEKYGVTHFPLVPPLLTALTRVKGSDRYHMRCLKQVSCGAAPVSMNAIQEFLEKFPHVDFIQGYGMTETAAVGTRGFNSKRFKNYTSVGLLAPNMEAKVVDLKTGSSLPPCNSGELWLRGPSIMQGYLNNSHATSLTVNQDGWLHTGDIGFFDQDGFLYLTDRLKEIIKYKGFQVAPAELESVIISHPDVTDVAVTAIKNQEAGEIPAAFVVRRPGSKISSNDVIDYVSQQVSPYKKVRQVVFVNYIPRSAAGKILRRQLRNGGSSKL
ncbi:hypothetical protein H6P81_007313 [Aristolochia fimbriata]|uniref:4-coumarate--CoA ligase n=1 Tax=Aristolochia fimbriata TaxID=158543 RepID=A0AAV7F0I1_ARIFI|nr:hypothetical protein H6P81_007313 [Aristolochia fimbriata]